MKHSRLLLAAASLSLAALPLHAQGTDTCAGAQAIAGGGPFAFDNSTATTDGPPDPLCYAFGNDQVENDVWFAWTAPASAAYRLETCGQTSVDTKVAAYDGPCGAPILACNDDACGLQSAITFPAAVGSVYTVRVGTFPGAAGGTGSFTIVDTTPQIIDTQVYPGNGRTYHLLEPSSWTIAQARAIELGGNLVTINDQAENDWVNATFHDFGGQGRSLWTGYNDDAVEGTFVWVSGEAPGYENWSPGEPNDSTGTENFAHFRSDWGNGTWNDLRDDPSGTFYSEVHGVVEVDGGSLGGYCFGDGSGAACPCGNDGGPGEGCANSSAAGARLSASGTGSVGADDLAFQCQGLLPNQPALLFVGENAVNGGNGVPFGDGLRCAGMNVVRLGVQVPDAAGDAGWGPGLAAQGGWGAGDVRYFQCWYRDPNGGPCGLGFNLSNGYDQTFAP